MDTLTRRSVAALALLGLALTPARAQRPADLWIIGARVFGSPGADTVAVRDGRIVAVQRGGVAPPGAQALDARGGWLLPGLHDAHVHVESGAAAAEQPALQGCEDVACVQAVVSKYAAETPGSGWLLARGWRYELVPGGYPTRQQLDAVVADRPVLLEAYDGHAQWANSRALDELGLGPDSQDPVGGTIVREADGRRPAGVLLEAAAGAAEDAVPPPPDAVRKRRLEAALGRLAALGLTSVEDVSYRLDVVPLYRQLALAGRLPIRVRVALPLGADLDTLHAARAQLDVPPRLAPGFLKGFLDGVVESRSAWLVDSYPGAETGGGPKKPLAWYRDRVQAAQRSGIQVALHCVGDGAVRAALDLFEEAQRAHPRPGLRHRIEHIEALHPRDVARFRELGVVASMQPYHAVPPDDPSQPGTWAKNLGPARVAQSFPWRSLRLAGATLAFGSDWPVLSADPLWGLAVATSRKNSRGLPAGGWHPGQRLPWRAAVRAYTVGGAAAAGGTGRGRILPGADADLVLLEPGVDPARPETLWSGPRVRATVVGGEVVVGGVEAR